MRYEPGSPEYLRRLKMLSSQLQQELAALDERAELADGEFLPTGGVGAYRPMKSPTIVVNRGWDAAMNQAADLTGILEPLMGLKDAIGQLSEVQAKEMLDSQRKALTELGIKDLPSDRKAWNQNGDLVTDYQATAKALAESYESRVRDQRLRETWGDDYQSLRLGKSGYTPQQFEEKSLNLQQSVMDDAVRDGLRMLASGDMKLRNGSIMLTLGSYADAQIRDALRDFYRSEGLSESYVSSHVAVNRKISNGLLSGIPDLRLGSNLLSDSTLANKSAETEQIRRWLGIKPNAYTVVVRPSFPIFPNYKPGSWVISPRSVIPITEPVSRQQWRL
jgi:hypothetical protein